MSLNDRCQEALDGLRAGRPIPNTPSMRAFLEGALEDGAEGTRFLPGIREAAADIQDQPAPAGVIDRDAVDLAIGAVLFNASNYPERVQVHILGRDIGPLRAKVTDAVLAVLPGRTERQIRADQREEDLAMHLAFRPEVVAEVAVHLSEESDWEAIANWCGGTVDAGPDGTDSGEWAAWIVLPDKTHVFAGMWIVQRHDLTFAVRHEVAGPSDRSVAQVKAEALREAAADRSLRLSGNGGLGVVRLRNRADELEREDGR